MKPFRVLVVDDSAFMRTIFSDCIDRDKSFQVVGTASNGREAVEKVKELDPDVVTLDVEMPEMNGLDALKKIMELGPRPIIMLSGINETGLRETILALEAGAFDFIRKPSISNALDIEQVRSELVKQLNAAMQAKQRRALWEEEEQRRRDTSTVNPASLRNSNQQRDHKPINRKTGRRTGVQQPWKPDDHSRIEYKRLPFNEHRVMTDSTQAQFHKRKPKDLPANKKTPKALPEPVPVVEEVTGSKEMHVISETGSRATNITDLVAVGCSTGGPRALKAFLEQIPGDFHAPIVIVQHMPPSFTKSLAQRLNSFSKLRVVEAEQDMRLQPGTAYIAPGGAHMRIQHTETGGYVIRTNTDEPRNGHRPSVDVLFESLMSLRELKRHVVLMTGMGSDGARVMKELYDTGVTSTFAESEQTCIVYGMPRSAVELGCVNYVLPLHDIAPSIVRAVNNGN
ncbi:hypothetical protein JCM10914A_54640 [Paenibacillus sp. JCM 10914]|uniref:protein-glutamate methylesterase/protein-glutamine glutaminase n=1 Tax=Paenibacillus sp. JCM 10914 TaxID=1236974 RepID=UPI0003CC8E24|nr:chemotaxis response regulator protein-glutamate methylesterase [Paenibacillus sp. JCM 10914]GAE04794.1 chemotaxis response regulator protein-glutamate methylesterase CheB [Paenibacillus sp. JCM 10914]